MVKKGFEALLGKGSPADEVILLEPELFHPAKSPGRFWRALKTLRHSLGRPFDVAVDLQGLLRSGLITLASAAPFRIGFANSREGSHFFYNYRVDIPDMNTHAVDRYLLFAEYLGIEHLDIAFPICIDPEARKAVRRLLGERVSGRPVVLLSIATTWQTKHWPVEKWIALSRNLIENVHARIVLVGRREGEKVFDRFVALADFPFLNLATKTSLAELVALIEEANLVISGDSAPTHIADALGTPLVALMGPTDPQRTGPYTQTSHAIRGSVDCRPCGKKRCPDPRCITEISDQEVLEMALGVLKEGR